MGNDPFVDFPGACCIKCYVWKRSQDCYEFYVSVPWKRNILQKRSELGYECKRNILYNRPLCNESKIDPWTRRLCAREGKNTANMHSYSSFVGIPPSWRLGRKTWGKRRGERKRAEKTIVSFSFPPCNHVMGGQFHHHHSRQIQSRAENWVPQNHSLLITI